MTALKQGKINNSRVLIGTLLLVLLSACSSVEKPPQWLNSQSALYSDRQYLTASAQADSREIADNRALANLAKVFQVSINDKSVDFSEASITQDNAAGRKVENKQTLSRVVNSHALQVLRGARIAEHWQDPVTGNYHSLAVMERAPAASAFTESIQTADEFTRDAINYAKEQAPTPLVALNQLEQARQRQIARANDNNNLRVLTGKEITPVYSAELLAHKISVGLAKLKMQVTADNDGYIKSLASAASTIGVTVVEKGDYTLSMAVETLQVERRQAWYWLRGSVVLAVTDKGSVISQQRHSFKVSAQEEALLLTRLQDKMSADLPEHVYALLTPQ